jgi:transcriptional regulator with XRE-family HTH domain
VLVQLSKIREREGLTLQQVADEVGSSVATIWRLEQTGEMPYRTDLLHKIEAWASRRGLKVTWKKMPRAGRICVQ